MDKLVREAWQKVYDANASNQPQANADYFHKYAVFVFRVEVSTLPDIAPQELMDMARECSMSISRDSWTCDDLKMGSCARP